MSATYDHDFADREASLSVTTPSGTTPVVTSAAYLPIDLGDCDTFLCKWANKRPEETITVRVKDAGEVCN